MRSTEDEQQNRRKCQPAILCDAAGAKDVQIESKHDQVYPLDDPHFSIQSVTTGHELTVKENLCLAGRTIISLTCDSDWGSGHTASISELTSIAVNEVCRRENATVEMGSYAIDVLETGAEDHIVWELENPLWLGLLLSVGSAKVEIPLVWVGASNVGSARVGNPLVELGSLVGSVRAPVGLGSLVGRARALVSLGSLVGRARALVSLGSLNVSSARVEIPIVWLGP